MGNNQTLTDLVDVQLTTDDIALIDRWIAEHGGNMDRGTAVLHMIRAAGQMAAIRQIDLSDGDAINRLINDRGM